MGTAVAAPPVRPRPPRAEKSLTIDAVPEKPRKALQAAAQHHPIPQVIKKVTKGKVTYETTVSIGPSSPHFIKVGDDGKLIERRRIDPRPTPAPRPRRGP